MKKLCCFIVWCIVNFAKGILPKPEKNILIWYYFQSAAVYDMNEELQELIMNLL